ncbi:MAG: hypothetical protein AAGJ46_12180 [Planctomycetota bacterium]
MAKTKTTPPPVDSPAATDPAHKLAIAASVEVRHHALDQCEVLIGEKRVGYMCYGKKRPMNWLPLKTIGLQLTVDERIAVLKVVREKVAELTEARDAKAEELRRLESGEDDA